MTSAPLMVSVSGLRGIVGASLTPETVVRFAAAFAAELPADGRVVVGRDSRPSGAMIAAAAAAAVTATGRSVIELGIVATPTAGVAVNALGAAGGMIATASHNPAPWNGLKCLDGLGAAPTADVAARIAARFRAGETPWADAMTTGAIERDDTAAARHVERVLAVVDVQAIRRRGFRVVLDSVCGAGGPAGRRLLEALGCTVVHLHGEPTGRFPHPPEPLAEHLQELAARTASEQAAVGFAQDPDADRLAVVDETGLYLGEECTLALAVRRLFAMRGGLTVAANLSTSRMVDDLAAAAGGRVVRTAVGEANVAAAMRQHGAAIGGEGNGGVILPEICQVRDSLSAMALVLDLLAAEGRPLSTVAAELPQYAMVKHKFDLDGVGGLDAVAPMLRQVAAAFPDVEPDCADGVRLDWPEGWVHLRPSNTEPIVRLIAEATTPEAADALIDRVMRAAGMGQRA